MAIGFSFAKPYINKRVKMFPVNSVYLSIVNTNPAVVLGYGTWVSFGTGKVLVGVDAADPDFNIPEKTGGNKTNTPSAHAGTSVADHVFTQPSGHSNHVFTQAANHVFTQPSAHSNHVFTQPSAHAVHLHDVGTLATSNHTSVSTKQGSSSGNVITTGTHSFTGSTANNSSTQSHSGGGVDAHSAHAGGGVDAHSGSGVNAHSAHAGGGVDSHNVTQPNNHAALSVLQPYITVFMFKRTA